MADISSLDSNLPWLWIIEYLSRFKQVDTDILHELIVKTPDLPDELTKNTRERVALRCLEELLDPAVGVASGVTPRVCFDHSQSCEDVLQQILQESPVSELISTSSELLKWDLHPFIVHKRATMPKSALEELKDTIRSSSHPYAVALRGISGLTLNNEPAGVPVRDGNRNALTSRVLEGSSSAQTVPDRSFVVPPLLKKSNRMSQHELCKRTALPSKRRGCKLATEDLMGSENGDQDSDDLHLNAKKLKQSVDQVSNPLLSKDGSERVVAAIRVDSHALLEHCHDDHIETPSTANKNGEDVARHGPVQSVMVDEMQQNNNPCEARVGTSHPSEAKIINDDDRFEKERENISIKKSHFLSSQCTLSQDPLGTASWTEQNLCAKCNKEGQLLECTASDCPLFVHENCLGFPAKFDDNGNIHCPFCAYSLYISKYLEAKRRVSLAKKDLSAFIRAVDLRSKEPAEGHEKEHRHSRSEQEKFLVRIRENGDLREKEQNPSSRNGRAVNQQLQSTADKQQPESSTSRTFQDSCVNDDANARRIQENEHLREKEQESSSQKVVSETEAEDDNNGDSSSHNTEPASVNEQEAEGVNRKEVLKKHVTDTDRQPHVVNFSGKGSSDNSDDKFIISKFCTRLRNRDIKHTYPAVPQTRRPSVPWTAEEEEVLRKGVAKFAKRADGTTPWKDILEFGGSLFHPCRTPRNLKEKWRTLCRRRQ